MIMLNSSRNESTLKKALVLSYGLLPTDQFVGQSSYRDLFLAYANRTLRQGGSIVKATGDKTENDVDAVGFLEKDRKFGTFLGPAAAVSELIDYSHVKFAFAEEEVKPLKVLETYRIYQIPELQTKTFSYNPAYIKMLNKTNADALMRFIALEDFGVPDPALVQWVKTALELDVVVGALGSPNDPVIKEKLDEINAQGLTFPEAIQDQILLGVGFATPGVTSGWLYGLYVHPSFRHLGIGTDLVMARLTMLQKIGKTSAITEIAEWNAPALALYQKLPVVAAGQIKFYGKSVPKVKFYRY